MKKVEIIEVPATTKEKEHLYCDWCKQEIFYWSDTKFISRDEKESWSYPECGYSKDYVYDICDECFKAKIIPLIKKEFDIEPRIEESEW